ncbi:sugar phosphate isomerase/epimerase family protein [Rummeliibacillus suwonensis]|uniref:sugar phosphate isomerase/epimerase family protein n=1 Tax=Rummeliibacillus suwonensis TaxID=1306154 RepID=UPI001AAF2A7D|nr:TIM barrel protein [Rummeliibacillus suwonensis]MBO2535617.1 sugar phosphate isomerase/epimerase [Rummeliibacillus suwonensis]
MDYVLSVSSFFSKFVNGTMNIKKFLHIAHRLNYKRVELCDLSIESHSLDYIRKLKRYLNKLKLNVEAVDIRNDLSLESETEVQKQIHHIETWIDVASQLNAKYVRIWVGEASNRMEIIEKVHKRLHIISNYAKQKEVTPLIENHGGISSNPDLLKELLSTEKNIGAIIDFGHFAIDDICYAIREISPYIKLIHVKSFNFRGNLEETTFDYFKIFEQIVHENYSGNLSIEYEGDGDPMIGVHKTRLLTQHSLERVGKGIEFY